MLQGMKESSIASILHATVDSASGNSPMVYAIIHDQIELIEELLEINKDLIKKLNKEGYSPVHFGERGRI